MKGNLLAFGITAGVLYAAYRGWNVKKSVEMFEYSVKDLKFRMEGLTPVISFKLNIYNPNKTGVPVNDILGQVFFKGNKVASFKNTQAITLAGQEARSIEMKARVNVLNVVSSLLKKDAEKDIKVDGLMKTGWFDLPFKYNYNLSNT